MYPVSLHTTIPMSIEITSFGQGMSDERRENSSRGVFRRAEVDCMEVKGQIADLNPDMESPRRG